MLESDGEQPDALLRKELLQARANRLPAPDQVWQYASPCDSSLPGDERRST